MNEDGKWTELEKEPVNAGNYKVVATVEADDNFNGAEIEMTFEITKAMPEYTLPTDLLIKQGEDLSSVGLPDGFAWKDNTQTADSLGEQTFNAIFTPEDTVNYQTVEVEITVEVVPGLSVINRMPVISAEDKVLTVGDSYEPMKGVTATDEEDGDITDKIEVTGNNVDTKKSGTYVITYKVTSSHGATATKTIKVTVEEKIEAETSGKDNNAENDVETGVYSNIYMWSSVSLLTVAGIILTVLQRRKKSQ